MNSNSSITEWNKVNYINVKTTTDQFLATQRENN